MCNRQLCPDGWTHQHRVPENCGNSRCAAALSSASACFGLPSSEGVLQGSPRWGIGLSLGPRDGGQSYMWVVMSVFFSAFTFCIDLCNPLGT